MSPAVQRLASLLLAVTGLAGGAALVGVILPEARESLDGASELIASSYVWLVAVCLTGLLSAISVDLWRSA